MKRRIKTMSMMEIIELMKQRRSVRSYTDEAVSDEVLDTILETATYAPTGGGKQSPVIVAVKDPETRDLISRLNAKVMGGDTDPFYGAPVIVLVLADGNRGSYVEDGSGVLNYIMLAAKACGVDSVWVAREKEIFDSEEGKALLKKWGLPDSLRGVGAAALGYHAGEEPEAAPRKEDYIIKI